MLQKTDIWRLERLGRFTASPASKLTGNVAESKTGLDYFQSDTARTYILEKAAEKLTGNLPDEISSSAIRWGNDYEPEARQYLELAINKTVVEHGLILDPHNDSMGFSPDGIISDKIGVEIKCPFKSSNHILNLTIGNNEMLKKYRKEYYWQIQHSLMCSDLDYWLFVSYDPRITGKHRMHIVKITRSNEDIKKLRTRTEKAINIRDLILTKIS